MELIDDSLKTPPAHSHLQSRPVQIYKIYSSCVIESPPVLELQRKLWTSTDIKLKTFPVFCFGTFTVILVKIFI